VPGLVHIQPDPDLLPWQKMNVALRDLLIIKNI
jgi:hypothetical protein